MKEYELGDKVAWVSQSQGTWTKKVGTVTQVIPADTFLNRVVNFSYYRKHFSLRVDFAATGRRKEVSYLVAVPPPEGSEAKWMLYWPNTKKLEDAHNAELGTTTF
jgi:hypothetical protein